MKGIKTRLTVMNFLIFASWGAYLCSLGIYLSNVGMVADIGKFFAIQGIVSLFMPALMGTWPTVGFPHKNCWASVICFRHSLSAWQVSWA